MTRVTYLTQHVQQAKEKLAQQHLVVAQREAAQRDVGRKDINKRRYLVGALAHEAGLFAWSNTALADTFVLFATLGDVPKSVVELEEALGLCVCADLGTSHGDLAEITLTRFCPSEGSMIEPSVPAAVCDGVVYVLQMDGWPWLKIGYTAGGMQGLTKRLTALQNGCPLPLRVRRAYTCEAPQALETRLHMVLASHRKHGEWFETECAAIDRAVQTLWQPTWGNNG